jgi:hypothetical protein
MKTYSVVNHVHRHGQTAEPLRGRSWGASGVRGVYETAQGRFQAKVRIHGRLYQAGTHDTKKQAEQAVRAKEREILEKKKGGGCG